MRYTIISINDRALENKQRTERIMGEPPVPINCFDASREDIDAALLKMGVKRNTSLERGEEGAFISHYRAWFEALKGDLIVFEDDAVLAENFVEQYDELMSHVPEDWDYVALWVPHNQENHYMEILEVHPEGLMGPILRGRAPRSQFYYDGYLAKSYQGYGQVAIVYSPDGASSLITRAKYEGMHLPVDLFMHFKSLAGSLDGFAPVPEKNTLVSHDWDISTTVHGTGF